MKLGITIGNSFATLATFNQEDRPIMIKDALSNHEWECFTPVKQSIDDIYAFIGNPVNTLLLNNKKIEVVEQFNHILDDPVKRYTDTKDRKWTYKELLALFVRKLNIDAAIFSSDEIEEYNFVLPAYFDQGLTEKFKEATDLIDLVPVNFIEDYKAAIYGYQLIPQQKKKNVLIYDFGKTHFHISIVSVFEKTITPIHISPRHNLGGQKIDQELISIIKQNFSSIGRKEDLDNVIPIYLESRVERIKAALSAPHLPLTREIMIVNETPYEIVITKSEYEELIQPIVKDTLKYIKLGLEEAALSVLDIDSVLMVGGCSKIDYIQRKIKAFFPHEGCQIYCKEPRKVLSKGAVIWAYDKDDQLDLSVEETNFKLEETITINVMNPISEEVHKQEYFEKGIKLPSEFRHTFSNFFPEQEKITFEVKKEDEKGDASTILGIIYIHLPKIESYYEFDLIAKIDIEENLAFSAFDKNETKELYLEYEKGIISKLPKIKVKRRTIRVVPKSKQVDKSKEIQVKVSKIDKPKIRIKPISHSVKISPKSPKNEISKQEKVILSIGQQESKKELIQEIIINNIL